jgi:hypothetical protein
VGIRRKGRLGKRRPSEDYQSIAPYISASGAAIDHGTLAGLADDDHSHYVHISTDRTITAQHSFSPATVRAPFLLGANAQGQLVTGLNADSVEGYEPIDTAAADAHLVATDVSGLASIAQLLLSGSTLPQLKIQYDVSNYGQLTAQGDGDLRLEATANLLLDPTGSAIFDAGGKSVYPANNYDHNLGLSTNKWLTLHVAELWVDTLVAQDVMSTIGGRVLIGATTELTDDMSAGGIILTTKHNQIRADDVLLMEARGQVEFLRVDGYAIDQVSAASDYFRITGDFTALFTPGVDFRVDQSTGNDGVWTVDSSSYSVPYTTIYVTGDITDATADGVILYITDDDATGPYVYWWLTRNLDGSGANDWIAGDAVFNTGQTGDGFIDLYAENGVLSGSGPTIVGNVRTGAAYNAYSPHWAIGNLQGLYGYGSAEYGVALGDYANENVTIENTNGIRFRDSTTTMLQIDKATGIWIESGTAEGEVIKSYSFKYSGTNSAKLMNWYWSSNSYHYLDLKTLPITNHSSVIRIRSECPSASLTDVQVELRVDAPSVYASLTLSKIRGQNPALLLVGTYAVDFLSGGSISATNDIEAGSGLYVGNTGQSPATGNIQATSHIRNNGGIYVGNIAGSVANGNLYATGDIVATSGMAFGNSGFAPGNSQLRWDARRSISGGGFRPWDGSTYYNAYAYIPLQSKITIFNGVSRSGTSSEWIDMTSIPYDCKAVQVRIVLPPNANGGDYAVSATSGDIDHVAVHRDATYYADINGIVAINASTARRIYGRWSDGGSALSVYLFIIGYFI